MNIEKILLAIVLIPLCLVMIGGLLDPGNPQNTEQVVNTGTQAIVDEATSMWLSLVKFGMTGAIAVVVIVLRNRP